METKIDQRSARKALSWLNTLVGGPIRVVINADDESKAYAIADIVGILFQNKKKFETLEFNNLDKYGIKTRLCQSDGKYIKVGSVEACVQYVRDNVLEDNEIVREFKQRCSAPAPVAKARARCACGAANGAKAQMSCEHWLKAANIGFGLLEDGLRAARERQDAEDIQRFVRLIANHRAEVAERLLKWG